MSMSASSDNFLFTAIKTATLAGMLIIKLAGDTKKLDTHTQDEERKRMLKQISMLNVA